MKRVTSPDGEFTATSRYFDTLTYGYYHVEFQYRRNPPQRICEFAAEGLYDIKWKDSSHLEIHYEEDPKVSYFALKTTVFYGVNIEYVPEHWAYDDKKNIWVKGRTK